MKTKYYLLILVLSCCSFLQAQDTLSFNSYQQGIRHVFGSLDSSFFPSGLLLNAAPVDRKMLTMNGDNTDSTVQGADWLFYYNNISHTSAGKYAHKHFTQLWQEQTEAFTQSNTINIPILNIQAHYLDDSAYYKGQIDVSAGVMTDRGGRSESPYKAQRIFCAAPMVHEFYEDNLRFYFPDSLYFSNDTADIISLKVDFGNGDMPRTVSFNTSVEVGFPGDGLYHITIELHTSDGIYRCRTIIKVDLKAERDGLICNGLGTLLDVYAEEMDIGPVDIVNTVKPGQPTGFVKGQYGVWLGCGHTQITKPFLVSAGFNPGNGKQLLPCLFGVNTVEFFGIDIPYPTWNGEWRGTYYETYNGAYNKEFTVGPEPGSRNGNNFFDKLREEGYDIVILQYEDGGSLIQNNAKLFTALIEKINQELKLNGSKHELVVCGYSAGAITTRYALAKMEKDFETYKNTAFAPFYPHHRCRLWLSVEGEYQGANVSLGFQHHLKFWTSESIPVSVGDMVGTMVSVMAHNINTQNTARQLNLASVEASAPPTMKCHSFRTDLLNDFNNLALPGTPNILKGYPLFCRRVGIAQGSGVGNTVNNYMPGSTGLTAIDMYANAFGFGDVAPVTFFRSSKAFFTSNSPGINFLQERKAGMNIFWGAVVVNFIPPSDWLYIYTNKLYNDWAPSSLQALTKTYGNPMHLIYNVLGFLNITSYASHYSFNCGFAPTVSCLDLHHPVTGVPLGSMGDAGWLTDVSTYGLFKLNNLDNHPFLTWGFPHNTYPGNKYKVTPFDAVWAVGTNYDGTLKSNHFHVEDPQMDMGYYMSHVETAPEHLFLSNRTIHDLGIIETYRADFEARDKITSGFDIYLDNKINAVLTGSINDLRHFNTENGDFIIEENTDVDFSAGEEIHLAPGFEAHTGSFFHAFIQPYPDGCINLLRNLIMNNDNDPENFSIFDLKTVEKREEIISKDFKVNVYPNPSFGLFTININEPNEKMGFVIYDIAGKKIYAGRISGVETFVHLEHKGLYFVHINIDTKREIVKLIVH